MTEKTKNDDMTTVNIRIEKSLKKSLDMVAKTQDLTSSQIIRKLIRQYVVKNSQTDLFKS